MAESFNCKKCGKPVRAHAKFCPHCGEKTNDENTTGILSFDDFFVEDDQTPEQPRGESEPEPEETPEQPEEETDRPVKPVFSFRDRQRKRKVKMIDDTLELPIEEIQQEIARRRERERLEQRSPDEKAAEKQKMSDEFEKLKKKHGEPEILISEDEILRAEDRPEKKSVFSRARDYLLGVDLDDIEGVDVKEEEAKEEKKARRFLRGEKDRKKESIDTILEPEDPGSEPAEPARTETTKPEEQEVREEQNVPVLSVPKTDAEKVEAKRLGKFSEEQTEDVKKTTWFGTLFDRKRNQTEEEMVVPLEAKAETVAEDEPADEPEPAAAIEETDAEQPEATPEQTKRRRNILLGVAAALLLAVGLGLFFTGNYMSDPLRLTESFAQAVEAEDMNAIAGMLHADGTQVTEESLEPFHQMLQNPDYKATLLSSLQTFDAQNGRSQDADVWIEEAGSRYYFFNAYRMHIKTFEVEPTVTYPGTQIRVDGGEPITVSPGEPVTVGPLLPGEHTIQSVYDGGVNPLHADTAVELTSSNETLEENRLAVNLANPGKYATFSSPQPEAMVLLNGEEIGKVKDLGEDGLRIGPFEDPVQLQLRLDTPLGQVTSEEKTADTDGTALDFTFPNMVEISDYHDEATLIVNGEETGAQGKDFIPFGRMVGPLTPEDTVQMEMVLEGRTTRSHVVTVGENESLRFSYWTTYIFPWAYSDATVYLDGEDTGQTVYQLAGDDMTAELLNSYETIQIEKSYPWGTFESNTVSLADSSTLNFSINPMNNTLYRQLQDAVVTFLEEDAFAISNLKPDNYSNIEDPLLSERRSYIQNLIDEKTRVVRVSETANFDMGSIQFDDEDTYYARITETYSYHYQEYEAGIFRPVRLQMQEAQEVFQHALRYDASAGKWKIYENRRQDSMGQSNTESVDLAY